MDYFNYITFYPILHIIGNMIKDTFMYTSALTIGYLTIINLHRWKLLSHDHQQHPLFTLIKTEMGEVISNYMAYAGLFTNLNDRFYILQFACYVKITHYIINYKMSTKHIARLAAFISYTSAIYYSSNEILKFAAVILIFFNAVLNYDVLIFTLNNLCLRYLKCTYCSSINEYVVHYTIWLQIKMNYIFCNIAHGHHIFIDSFHIVMSVLFFVSFLFTVSKLDANRMSEKEKMLIVVTCICIFAMGIYPMLALIMLSTIVVYVFSTEHAKHGIVCYQIPQLADLLFLYFVLKNVFKF